MKKVIKIFIVFLLLFSLFSVSALAREDKSEELWEDFIDITPEGSVSENIDESLYAVGVESLFAEIIASIGTSGLSGRPYSLWSAILFSALPVSAFLRS